MQKIGLKNMLQNKIFYPPMGDYNDAVAKSFKVFNHEFTLYIKSILKSKIGDNYYEWIKEFAKGKKVEVEFETPLICQILLEKFSSFQEETPTLTIFSKTLIFEVKHFRNVWAHQNKMTSEDAYRAVDSCYRLLKSINISKTSEDYLFKIKAWLLGECAKESKNEYEKRKRDEMDLIEE